jgi:hypothetical protein
MIITYSSQFTSPLPHILREKLYNNTRIDPAFYFFKPSNFTSQACPSLWPLTNPGHMASKGTASLPPLLPELPSFSFAVLGMGFGPHLLP